MGNDETGFRRGPVFRRSRLRRSTGSHEGGFTLLELLVVLVIGAITMGIGVRAYAGYQERSAAYRSAQVFARDLTLARNNAIQIRDQVTIRFSESDLEYDIVNADQRVLARRGFGAEDDFSLGSIDLQMPDDSLVINGRGVLDLSALTETLGTAAFSAGGTTFTVSFNALGDSRLTES